MKKQFKVFGEHDQATIAQYTNVFETSDYAMLMADGHLGYGVPIGCVMANKAKITPQGVGFDIGCGNTATAICLKQQVPDKDLHPIGQQIAASISFGFSQQNKATKQFPALVEQYFDLWKSHNADKLSIMEKFWHNSHYNDLMDLARQHIATVGGGNHYIDVFADNDGIVWVGVHFGSRGFGYKIAKWFMDQIGCKGDTNAVVKYITQDHTLFNPYFTAMVVAQQFASTSRNLVCAIVQSIVKDVSKVNSDLPSKDHSKVENHHNAVWQEYIDEVPHFVVRKGATPFSFSQNQHSFVGATMLENSYIIAPTSAVTNETCLNTVVHGAGRVLPRRRAKGKKAKDGSWLKPPVITTEQMQNRIKNSGVIVIGGDVDEDMLCYKRLDEVFEYHQGMIQIVKTLKPLIVLMAGKGDVDLYKD